MADKTYTVTVASGDLYSGGTGNVFYLDGVRYLSFKWVPGATLRLDQSASSNDNHPLVFSTNTSTAGIISSGVAYYLDGSSNQANYTNTTTFNAATTRYVEITASSYTDFYYLCYVHGIGMGGDMDMVNNSWNANAWGDNSWQSLTSNISPSGQLLSLGLGVVENAFPSAGWGGESWSEGEWGSVGTGNQIVTGFGLGIALGNVSQTSSTGWGRLTWGSDIWNGYGTTLPSGVAATMALSTQVLIDGEINAGWGRLGWNINAWGVRGQVGATGQAMTMAQSSVTIDNEVNTGWSSDGWGVEGWGASIQIVSVSGQTMTAFEGSAGLAFDGNSNVDVVGRAMTATLGEESVNIKVGPILTGFALTMQQTFDSPTVTVSGIVLTATLGDEASEFKTIAEVNAFNPGYWGYRSTWGFSAWGNGQTNTLVMSMLENFSGTDAAPDAEATGQAMAIALAAGNTFDISGDANIAPLAAMGWSDGTWGESTWGDGLYRPDTDDIFSITAALGTATLDAVTNPTITGLGVQQVRVGNVTVLGEGNVIPTGNNLTINQGTGTNVLIWNAVDTGSAPTTPPGWQEVPTNAA